MKETMFVKLSHLDNTGNLTESYHYKDVAHPTEAFYSIMNFIMKEYRIPLPDTYLFNGNIKRVDGTPFLMVREEVMTIPLDFYFTKNTLLMEKSPNHTLSSRGNSRIGIDIITQEEYSDGVNADWDRIQAEGMGHPYPVREKSEHQKVMEEETARAFGRVSY